MRKVKSSPETNCTLRLWRGSRTANDKVRHAAERPAPTPPIREGLDVSGFPPSHCDHETHSRRRPVAHHLWGLTSGRKGVARKTGSSQGPFLLGKLTLDQPQL